MNDAVTLTGFVKESPHIKEMADGNAIAHFVVIVYDDDRNVSKEIPVLAMGKIATEAQFTLQRGVFISIYGTHGNFEKKTFTANGLKFPTIEVVAKTIEVLHTPDVKGMSVEDFIKIYSSEAITNRIKKITDKATGKTPNKKKGAKK